MHVVGQRLGIGTKPQAEAAGHGHLQMGIARHQRVLVLLAERLQAVEEQLHLVGQLTHLVAIEQLQVYQHLVVARAPRVYLLTHSPESLRQQVFHLRVHVLYALLYREVASLYVSGYALQFCRQHRQLVGSEQPYTFQHRDVSQRSLYVVASQLQVQFAIVAYGEILYQLVYIVTLIPKFHFLLFYGVMT